MMGKKIMQLGKPSIRTGAILMVASIVVLQVLAILLEKFFGLGTVNLSQTFMFIVVGAAVLLPYIILDAPPRFTTMEIGMIVVIIMLDIFLLAVIMPLVMPNMFTGAAQAVIGIG
jgi:hypothetical protein